jgi:adenylate cyclase class 2
LFRNARGGGQEKKIMAKQLEVEMKFPVRDLAPLQHRLEEWGATADSPRQDADHYFNAPDRDFARTDEALRLRRIGLANYVTYKGPKRDAQTKTRTEIEVAIAEGDEAAESFSRLLVCLGYRPVAIVRKQRRIFHLQREGIELEICLDKVEGLGQFAEVEILASEEELERARELLLKFAGELGLSASERRSYLELLLARNK